VAKPFCWRRRSLTLRMIASMTGPHGPTWAPTMRSAVGKTNALYRSHEARSPGDFKAHQLQGNGRPLMSPVWDGMVKVSGHTNKVGDRRARLENKWIVSLFMHAKQRDLFPGGRKRHACGSSTVIAFAGSLICASLVSNENTSARGIPTAAAHHSALGR